MKKTTLSAILLSLGAALVSCGEKQATSDLSWGHLQDQSLNPAAPQYLINKKPGDVYKVCIPRYMVDELPGVEAEVHAAINVWAGYLGRAINVETSVKDLPRATATDTPTSLQTAYYAACGDEFDVVIGFAPLRGSTVGQTGSSWRGYSAQKITSFKRYLFLRDYKASPDLWGTTRWISLQDLRRRAADSSEILNQMQARDTMEVAPRGTSIALAVLVHEFGHVWGMCDQYEGPSNCDPNFKSEHPDLKSMMAAASNVAKLYLTDDDITGIRALAQRPGFNASWPGTEGALNKAPAAVAQKDVEYFQLKSVEKAGTQFTLNFGLVTNKGGELRFEYRTKGAAAWQQSTSFFPSDDAFMIPDYSFRQTVRTEGDYEFRLKLRLKEEDSSLGEPMYTTL
ncbi:MAG TPA: hypothetical protein VFO10_00820 [Oligoflexus sp.]|uniref:hypothetical protein n=1 Tax=Oligoflexus sp. TaxID=1971216 RepID=UPI002D7F1A4B|nr:hypothetical protein [Oligoflexus sp.]HET9235757.1 hypothetical protein [Oligoflexus sp.]